MNKQNCILKIKQEKIIAIIRGCSAIQCLETAEALYEGGIRLVEITFDHTGIIPFQETIKAIQLINEKMERKICVGAGTVLDSDQVEEAAAVGARYIISPDINEKVIYQTNERGMVSIPGALTPTEIAFAFRTGADFVKVFPAAVLGPEYIKALKGPLGHIPLLAVGGIGESNLGDYLKAGCSGFGIGGKLADRKVIAEGNFRRITEAAKIMTSLVQEQ